MTKRPHTDFDDLLTFHMAKGFELRFLKHTADLPGGQRRLTYAGQTHAKVWLVMRADYDPATMMISDAALRQFQDPDGNFEQEHLAGAVEIEKKEFDSAHLALEIKMIPTLRLLTDRDFSWWDEV